MLIFCIFPFIPQIRVSMTSQGMSRQKYLTERDPNRADKKKLFNGCKPIKFQKIKKDSIEIFPQTNPSASHKNINRLFPYDHETLKDMVKELKQQNGELKQVMKIQQTQINYFQEQQKTMIENSKEDEGIKKLRTMNLQLKRSNQNLRKQNEYLKKNPKFLKVKQLETMNDYFLQQIKNLTAKLKVFKNNNYSYNVEQLNKVIENEYLVTIENKQLEAKLKEKELELENSSKIMRKLKNLVTQKNKEIEELKELLDSTNSTSNKNKNLEDYVHKNELISKKKQLLILSEKIQTLELKLNDCQNKVQSLKQENIENMNREAQKRKQLATSYHELKKNYELLEEAFNQSMKKGPDSMLQQIRLDKVPSDAGQNLKKKNPMVVDFNSVKNIVEELIYSFQKLQIDQSEAIKILTTDIIHAQESKAEQIDEQKTKKVELSTISIRKVMYKLDQQPINLSDYQSKELLARYLVEDPSQDMPEIDFDSEVNIEYVKSILNKILNNYVVFSEEDIAEQILIVQEFLKRQGHSIRASLATIKSIPQNLDTNRYALKYQCHDILEAIKRENILSEFTEQFIKFYTFQIRQQALTYEQFCCSFKKAGLCTFITQDSRIVEGQSICDS